MDSVNKVAALHFNSLANASVRGKPKVESGIESLNGNCLPAILPSHRHLMKFPECENPSQLGISSGLASDPNCLKNECPCKN